MNFVCHGGCITFTSDKQKCCEINNGVAKCDCMKYILPESGTIPFGDNPLVDFDPVSLYIYAYVMSNYVMPN